MKKSKRDLSQTEQWYRSVLYEVLIWGITVGLVYSGWLVSPGEIASFYPEGNESSAESHKLFMNALFLVFCTPVFLIVWILLLEYIHKKCPKHITILSIKKLRYSYLIITLFLLIIMLSAIDIDNCLR